MKWRRGRVCRLVLALILLLSLSSLTRAQQPAPHKRNSIDAARVQQMLKDAYYGVKKNHYDKNYHGVARDAKYREAKEQLKDMSSNAQGFSVVANLRMTLEDSHSFFFPPSRGSCVEYSFRVQRIGDRARQGLRSRYQDRRSPPAQG